MEHSTTDTSHNFAMNKFNSAAWNVQTQTGINGLVFEEDIASSNNIGDHDCLIAIEASSLNYRDIMIANVRLHNVRIQQDPNSISRAHTLSRCLCPSSQAQTHREQSSPSAQK